MGIMAKLSMKRQLFIKEYIKNKGNGTQAVLKVYNTTDPNTARAMAPEILANPSVREQLDKALTKEGTKLDAVVDNIASIAVTEPTRGYSGADVLEANKTLLKLHGVLTDRKQVTTLNVNAELQKLSKYELIERHKKLQEETTRIIEGEEVL